MSLFSNLVKGLLLLSALLMVSLDASAINIAAVYSSACQREIGIIIDADDSRIRLLKLDGTIIGIDRFDIIYMAYYPVGDLPIPKARASKEVDIITIRTIYQGEIVDLLTGWMIDTADEQASFLTTSGQETVLDYEDIWDIDISPYWTDIQFQAVSRQKYRFIHPYPFMHCNNQAAENDHTHNIYPQHLLEDPILIRKELDRLKGGYDRFKGFDVDKVFYAKPQIYRNEARLGLWAVYGSRYGGTRQRNNNFIPEIISESSDGPFGFQHILVTGNALMPSGLHEEPQMHFLYGLKADYIHFAIMVDFNRYVIGESKYQWHSSDLLKNDNRENDTFDISGGFDYGWFSIDFSVWNRVQYGIRHDNYFHENSIRLNKGGVIFENRTLKAELYYGFGDDKKEDSIPIPDSANEWEIAYIEAYNAYLARQPKFFTDYAMARLNLTLFFFDTLNPRYSLIYREIDFRRDPNPEGVGNFKYRGTSLTNALYMSYRFDDEIRFSGFLSIEILENSYGTDNRDDSSSLLFPKAGFSAALMF